MRSRRLSLDNEGENELCMHVCIFMPTKNNNQLKRLTLTYAESFVKIWLDLADRPTKFKFIFDTKILRSSWYTCSPQVQLLFKVFGLIFPLLFYQVYQEEISLRDQAPDSAGPTSKWVLVHQNSLSEPNIQSIGSLLSKENILFPVSTHECGGKTLLLFWMVVAKH